MITDFLAGALLPSLGYHTLVAQTGERALELAKSQRPDLMLIDFQLQTTTGLAVLGQLVEEGYRIPSILFTAEGSEQIAVEAFRLGVEDYLIKPVDAESLGNAITRALTETRLRREKESLTAQLKQQVTWLTALSKVGQMVTSSLKLDEVLRRIVEASVYLTQAEEGFLALVDDQSGQLYLRAVKNIDQERSETLQLRVGDPLVRRVMGTGRPVRVIQDTEGQPIKVSTGLLARSLLHVPVLSKDKILGVLSMVNHTSGQAFTEMDEKQLASLADHASVAIENAKLYERTRREISERVQAEEQLETSLREKEVLLKEIHHRVKNNLQVITSLLHLQSRYVEDQEALKVFRESQSRVKSMALIHERLYQSDNLARIDFAEYIRDLTGFLSRTYSADAETIAIKIKSDDVLLGIDAAVPSGLILNELVSNALKHAFPNGQTGQIWVELAAGQDQKLSLRVSDDGIGFPEMLDWQNTNSLGLQLVNSLVNQLDGAIQLDSSNGETTFDITFANPDQALGP
jgi:two-component sensor histidine kinase/CheY-like chemotaxis protein